jgi:hypothetical protein
MKVVIALLLATAALLAPLARAGELAVAPNVVFRFEDPPGTCQVDPAQSEPEKSLFSPLRSSSAGKGVFVILTDCVYLDGLRSGKADFAQVTHGIILGVMKDTSRDSRRALIASIKEIVQPFVDDPGKLQREIERRFPERAAEFAGAFDDDNLKSFRFIADDPDALYVSIVMEEPGLALVAGTTVLRGHPVGALSLRTEAELDRAISEMRATMAQLIALNDPEGKALHGPYYWLGIEWDRLPKWVWTVVVVGGFVWWRHRRQYQFRPHGGPKL